MHRARWVTASFRLAGMAGVILSLLVAGPPPASAAPGSDPFTVAGVSIDATADNTNQAREQALAAGQRKAARILLERLTLRRDQSRLPPVGAAEVVRLVKSFEIDKERTSNVRYLAELTVTFNPEPVRALLRDAGVPFTEAVSPRVLVLPVWRTADGGALLFDDGNPWRASWMRIGATTGLVPVMVPEGDAADVAAISPEQALGGDPAALRAIAQRYEAGAVVVTMASGTPQAPSQVTASRIELPGMRRTSLRVGPKQGADAMLTSAYGVLGEIEEGWKAATLVDTSQSGTLQATVPIGQLSDWIAIRRRLEAIPAIRQVEVEGLGVGEARIALAYSGTVEQLRSALAQADLILSQEGAGWTLRSGARPASSEPAVETRPVQALPAGALGEPHGLTGGRAATPGAAAQP